MKYKIISILNIPDYSALQVMQKNTGVLKLKGEPDSVYDLNHCGIGTLILDTAIGDNRNNGIVLHTTNALIENCRIGPGHKAAVKLGALLNWQEGPPPYNVIIRKNKMEGKEIVFRSDFCITPSQC